MVGLLLGGLLLAACSDAPLARMGNLTERWIAAAPDSTAASAPTTTGMVSSPIGLFASDGHLRAEWVNDQLGDSATTLPAVDAAWDRSNRRDRYVQASRSEIAAALPGLEFPALIPADVAFITSQFVFDPATGELSSDTQAAFGFWSVQPYSRSRSAGQQAVLTVAVDQPTPDLGGGNSIGENENPPGETRCDEPTGSTIEDCEAVTLPDGRPAWSFQATDGWRLVWSERGYEYDLFVRKAAGVDFLVSMAASLEGLAPASPTLAAPDDAGGTPTNDGADEAVGVAGS